MEPKTAADRCQMGGTLLENEFSVEGVFTIGLTVTDPNGNSDNTTHTVEIVEFTDPVQVINNELVVNGSDEASERIVISSCGAPGNLLVRVGYDFYGPFSVERARINGGGNDSIIFNGGVPVVIDGGAGNDYIAGTPNDDLLFGGPGNDVILAGEGSNTADGGEGNDRNEGRSGNDLLLGGLGNDRINGGAGDEILDGGEGNDQGFEGLGDDLFFGRGGFDVLDGSWGNDALIGGDHYDIPNGRGGNDVLISGSGSDNMRGGAGDDLMVGDATSFDSDQAALLAILAEWAGAANRTTQATDLLGAVLADGAIVSLNGDSGADYYLPIGSDSFRFSNGEDVRIP